MTLRNDPVDMNGRRLKLVPKQEESADDERPVYTASDPGPLPETPESHEKLDASQIIGNAVSYAAMSWIACCVEQQGVEVSVAQVGAGIFDAEVKLADGGSRFLRVTLALEHGPRLRTLVEPIHP